MKGHEASYLVISTLRQQGEDTNCEQEGLARRSATSTRDIEIKLMAAPEALPSSTEESATAMFLRSAVADLQLSEPRV